MIVIFYYIIYTMSKKKFDLTKLEKMSAEEVIDKIQHDGYSLLETLGASKMRREMVPVGKICNAAVNYVLGATLKGESEEEFCARLIADVSDDNFNRIIVEFDKQELSDFSLELSHAIDDVTHCDSYYKCTGACLGRYGACEYLPLCRNKCDLHGVESLYEQKQKVFEEISDETLKQGA